MAKTNVRKVSVDSLCLEKGLFNGNVQLYFTASGRYDVRAGESEKQCSNHILGNIANHLIGGCLLIGHQRRSLEDKRCLFYN